MDAGFFARLVTPAGELDDHAVTDRRVLYTSPNGKSVERFAVRGDKENRRYIFKPLTNEGLLGREHWAQKHLLPLLPMKYPELLAAAAQEHPEAYWTILADMGALTHEVERETLVRAVRAVCAWHKLPVSLLPAKFAGAKPMLDEVTAIVLQNWGRLESLLSKRWMPPEAIVKLKGMAEGDKGELWREAVVSHGDLHIGNVALKDGSLIVLDWEHIHLNSALWDLFSLLDMTHPSFRRRTSDGIRYEALRAYAAERQAAGWPGDADTLIRDYDVYASIYSAWLLLLIEADLQRDSWDRDELLAQDGETLDALISCVSHFGNKEISSI